MGQMFKRSLGRIPYRGHILELQRTTVETPSIPVNKAIRQYFGTGNENNVSSNEDWLQKSELPTAEEILGVDEQGEDVLLAPNRVTGPWSSKEEYLKTHYCLIREDSVAPLRDAVTMVRNNPHMHDAKSISIYEKVSLSKRKRLLNTNYSLCTLISGLRHQGHACPTRNRIAYSLLHQTCWKEDSLGIFEPPDFIFRRRPLSGKRCLCNKVCSGCCCSETSGECYQEPS